MRFLVVLGLASLFVSVFGDNSCTNDADYAIWTAHKSTFESEMEQCGKQCLGNDACVTSCIEELDGYSATCSSCFGDLAQCTANNCWNYCILGSTTKCKSCTASKCDPAFSTCSGIPVSDIPTLPVPSKETTTDACTNDADYAIWTAHKSTFESEMEDCGKQCLGNDACVTSCIEELDGYSATCSACFGDLAQCTANNCWNYCILGSTTKCKSCTATNCDPAFSTCSGIPVSDIPTLPVPSKETTTDACTNDADYAIWTANIDSFESDMTDCGKQCLGKASCVTSCIEDLDGYSATCSACFGDLAQCTADNCWNYCILGATDKCKSCTATNCDPAFSTCSGIPEDEIPQ